jgi:hypothetical protein
LFLDSQVAINFLSGFMLPLQQCQKWTNVKSNIFFSHTNFSCQVFWEVYHCNQCESRLLHQVILQMALWKDDLTISPAALFSHFHLRIVYHLWCKILFCCGTTIIACLKVDGRVWNTTYTHKFEQWLQYIIKWYRKMQISSTWFKLSQQALNRSLSQYSGSLLHHRK